MDHDPLLSRISSASHTMRTAAISRDECRPVTHSGSSSENTGQDIARCSLSSLSSTTRKFTRDCPQELAHKLAAALLNATGTRVNMVQDARYEPVLDSCVTAGVVEMPYSDNNRYVFGHNGSVSVHPYKPLASDNTPFAESGCRYPLTHALLCFQQGQSAVSHTFPTYLSRVYLMTLASKGLRTTREREAFLIHRDGRESKSSGSTSPVPRLSKALTHKISSGFSCSRTGEPWVEINSACAVVFPHILHGPRGGLTD